jgi:hypothetical protein
MRDQDVLNPEQDFNLLSLRDLLAARDQFHLHLVHKENVIATAVGKYRIRKDDPWPDKDHPRPARSDHPKRTLANSEVRSYSWPAILVFVEQWMQQGELAHPEDAVPPAIYMPNGQKVPICVIEAERDNLRPEGEAHYSYPASVMGGGYPVICDIQNREHIASVACLVTDGSKTYALTNRHVVSNPGTHLSAIVGRNKVPIGTSARGQLTRKPFKQIYPGWPGDNVYVDQDVGLIDLDNLDQWTTQVYGVGEIGPLADLDVSNISLRLIGCPVRAHGAASGDMRGEICALFYRFKSLAGFDYVADVLIGPKGEKPLGTHPGDSGTLWLIDASDPKHGPRPLALQWGGQRFFEADSTKASSYALATFLSTVCNELNVSLLRGWNDGLPEYWGAVGHYSIATEACKVIQDKSLKQLMSANLERISFAVPDIRKKTMQGLSKRDFVPLADVPDMVWKVGPFKRGGMNSPEHANHFADMDRELKQKLPEGATLLAICKGKPQNVSVEVWRRYYDAVKKQFPTEHESRGLLPFRVWQIYDAMVSFVREGKVAEFVGAAGILSHYVGDSCQPLHISFLFNGDPDHMVPGTVRDQKTGEKKHGRVATGTGVHAAYEDVMIDRHVEEVITGVDSKLQPPPHPPSVKGGHAAAVAVVDLMQQTFDTIPPREIISEFLKVEDEKPAARADAMWSVLGERTIKVMADGCICLARLWDSAWKEGDGDSNINSLRAISEGALEKLYQNPNFLPSHTLDTIGPLLNGASTSRANRRPRARSRSRRRRA